MAITRKDVEYVANLSRIALTDAEKEKFTAQLAAILSYVEKLKELDTAGVEPMMHATHEGAVFREDRAGKMLPQDDALSGAPKKSGGFFKVPKVLE